MGLNTEYFDGKLFGKVTPSERVLGYNDDNVFVDRAIEATNDNEIGVLYEADDDSPNDR